MSNLLIIGGSGFIGKSIIDYLNKGGFESENINYIDIVSRGAKSLKDTNPELISENVRLHNIDITTCKKLPRADLVIHAAASTNARLYQLNPQQMAANINLSIDNFCRIAREDFYNSKVLYLSSGAVYGQQPSMVKLLHEDFEFLPINTLVQSKRIYAEAKRYGELKFSKLFEFGMAVSIARCFTFWGKYLPIDQHFAIGNFINDALTKEKIIVKTNQLVYRSYMSADDMAEWLIKICKAGNSTNLEVINVGSDEEIALHELASLVAKNSNKSIDFSGISIETIDRYVPNIDRAKKYGLFLKDHLGELLQKAIKNG
jgi:nucleoside-diphosphate-sugar epimerase